MGSQIEINDTLVITRKQGFPKVLDLKKHLGKSFSLSRFKSKTFTFAGKEGIRVFSPVNKIFFVEKTSKGEWIYWGIIKILTVSYDYTKNTTSGTFKIVHLNTPKQMKQAYEVIDRDHKPPMLLK